MYFVNKALQGVEQRYSKVEKVIIALVHIAKKLWLHFQAYPIRVLMDLTLREVLSKPKAFGQMVN